MPAATASAEARPVGLRDVGVAAGGMGGEDMQVTAAKLLHLLYRAMEGGGSGEKGTGKITNENQQ
jgi:hypothetical protein